MPLSKIQPVAQANSGAELGMRNRIINGAMMIDQRNAGALITSVANGAYMVDRFQCYHDIGTLNARQNLNSLTPPTGFKNYLGFANTSSSTSASTNYFNFNTSVEGLNWADLGWGTANAQTVTLSFWVRSSIAGTYSIAINGQNTYGYPATYTINQADTWEFKTITVAGPTAGTWVTDNTRSVSVIWDLGQGSNYRFAAGSWQSGTVQGATGSTNWNQTNGATFYITGVQLEKGSVATPFEWRPYGTELALCQRYLPAMSFAGGTNPYFGSGMAYSTTAAYYTVAFPVTPRVPPTGLTVSAASHFAGFLATTATSNATAVVFGGADSHSAFVGLTGMSGLVAGNATLIYMSNSSALMLFTGCEL